MLTQASAEYYGQRQGDGGQVLGHSEKRFGRAGIRPASQFAKAGAFARVALHSGRIRVQSN